MEVKEGEVCPKTGVWIPSNNPNFYPAEYARDVMERHFVAGDIMPRTPHGEPSWILKEQGTPLQDFTGLTAEEVLERSRGNKTREHVELEELRKTYAGLGYEQKLDFLGVLHELLRKYDGAKGKEYDAAGSAQERLGMLHESGELHRLIHSVAAQKRTTRERPLDEADTLWRQIEEFFGLE